MSYILEALKQAEEERGSDRLSKVLSASPVEDVQQSSVDWKKWLTIAIFINAMLCLFQASVKSGSGLSFH